MPRAESKTDRRKAEYSFLTCLLLIPKLAYLYAALAGFKVSAREYVQYLAEAAVRSPCQEEER